MTTRQRPRGVMLDRIYTANLTVICQQIFELQYGVKEPKGFKVWDDLVIARDPNAKADWYDRDTILICSEGVGWECNERGLILVPTGDGDGGIYVSGTVLQKLKNGKQVDLADHVRTFGDRLENNFDLWHSRLTTPKKEAV